MVRGRRPRRLARAVNRLSVPRRRAVGAITLLIGLLAGCADKAEVDGQHIRVRLVSEQTTIAPGRPFWVGLHQTLDDGWHTYWRNPGDSGAAARIEWHLPAGWTASSIHWPIPERMPYGDLMNFGYSGEVLLPVMITPPADLERGRVELSADALWLVCADVCIPEEGRLRMTLRVRPRAEPADARETPLFGRWRTRIPVAIDGARARRLDERVAITVPLPDAEHARQVWFFPHAGGVVVHAGDQEHRVSSAGTVDLLVEPEAHAADRLDGVVVVSTVAGTRGFAIDVPIEDGTGAGG